MKSYKEYLKEQHYSKTTIDNYTSQVKKFITWCKRNHTSPESIDYKTCMKYLKYLGLADFLTDL
jgi:site-specific recombinase XerD